MAVIPLVMAEHQNIPETLLSSMTDTSNGLHVSLSVTVTNGRRLNSFAREQNWITYGINRITDQQKLMNAQIGPGFCQQSNYRRRQEKKPQL